jgi:hypothetical protein
MKISHEIPFSKGSDTEKLYIRKDVSNTSFVFFVYILKNKYFWEVGEGGSHRHVVEKTEVQRIPHIFHVILECAFQEDRSTFFWLPKLTFSLLPLISEEY